MKRACHDLLVPAVTCAAMAVPLHAWAQAGPAPAGGAVLPGQPSPTPGSTYVPMVPQVGGYGNPQSPNGTIGGGNATESSAHPVTGEEEDSFDLGPRGAGGGTVHGDESGPVFVGGGGGLGLTYGGEVPNSHTVRKGDTLWGLCGFYFQNPYEWPRIWSYNAQIRNPNWIYPGDEVRLRQGGGGEATAGGGVATPTAAGAPPPSGGKGMNLIDRRRQVPQGTVFLRDMGWIRDQSDEVWGDVTGSPQDKMFLTDTDVTYLHIEPGHDVHVGQELTVFRPLRVSAAGTVVKITGTVRVDDWNDKERVARAKVIESLDPIERGAKIGPLTRRFEIVPPRRNEGEVQAHVLASVYPNEFWGQNQVVFVDKGEDAGLKPGNRLFIIRRGDAWRQTLVTPTAGYRVSADGEKPLPALEQTPGAHKDEASYPDEVVGELRVIAVRKDSATCFVTHARLEIERGDLAVERKGY